MERRKTRRFELAIPVILRWSNEEQSCCEGAGFCRDISTSGVFVVVLSAAPPVAATLQLIVLLPSLNARGPGLRLHAAGYVVRMETMAEATGVGIASRFGDFADATLSLSYLPEETAAVAPCC